jgi:hypothetical protein
MAWKGSLFERIVLRGQSWRLRELSLAGQYKPLINCKNQLGGEAELAVPTPGHYLPLLYVVGTRTPPEPLTFPAEGGRRLGFNARSACGLIPAIPDPKVVLCHSVS